MKISNEKEFLELLNEYYSNENYMPGKCLVAIFKDDTEEERWYFSRNLHNADRVFFRDRPNLHTLMKKYGISWEEMENSFKGRTDLGSIIMFRHAIIGSTPYAINPEAITNLPISMEELIDMIPYCDFPCGETLIDYYMEVTEEEFWKDVEKFREGKNEYHTKF